MSLSYCLIQNVSLKMSHLKCLSQNVSHKLSHTLMHQKMYSSKWIFGQNMEFWNSVFLRLGPHHCSIVCLSNKVNFWEDEENTTHMYSMSDNIAV